MDTTGTRLLSPAEADYLIGVARICGNEFLRQQDLRQQTPRYARQFIRSVEDLGGVEGLGIERLRGVQTEFERNLGLALDVVIEHMLNAKVRGKPELTPQQLVVNYTFFERMARTYGLPVKAENYKTAIEKLNGSSG